MLSSADLCPQIVVATSRGQRVAYILHFSFYEITVADVSIGNGKCFDIKQTIQTSSNLKFFLHTKSQSYLCYPASSDALSGTNEAWGRTGRGHGTCSLATAAAAADTETRAAMTQSLVYWLVWAAVTWYAPQIVEAQNTLRNTFWRYIIYPDSPCKLWMSDLFILITHLESWPTMGIGSFWNWIKMALFGIKNLF